MAPPLVALERTQQASFFTANELSADVMMDTICRQAWSEGLTVVWENQLHRLRTENERTVSTSPGVSHNVATCTKQGTTDMTAIEPL